MLNDANIELTSNKRIYIDGCQSILDFNSDFIKLDLKSCEISIFGDELEMHNFVMGQILIEGTLLKIEFT